MGGCFAVLILVLIVDFWCCLMIFDQMAVYLIAALVAHEADALMITDHNAGWHREGDLTSGGNNKNRKTTRHIRPVPHTDIHTYTEHQSIHT
jgi:hypothetical protein